ncbi:hypothetical protein [Candidatus Uabimicrobium sp. HlEnr_7]|uniref:hypothetical protein n=1 Tax=Candidatus Uabimicrobium helgolandensis TaxID=3095367 RepID=UPI00355745D8
MKKYFFLFIFILSLALIKTIFRLEKKPLIYRVQGSFSNVISAPHDGYELYTGKIAHEISSSLKWGLVIAKYYRAPSINRWINVNRPTEKFFRDGKLSKAIKTKKAVAVFQQYLKNIKQASKSNISILVEIHGHNRKYPKSHEFISSIEVTSKGFTYEELLILASNYKEVVSRQQPHTIFPLQVDYLLTESQINYSAQKAKTIGIFNQDFIHKSLHFELPKKLRTNDVLRKQYTKILIKLLHNLQQRSS